MRRALVIGLVILAALVAAGPTAGAAVPRRGMYLQFRSDGFLVEADSNLGSGRLQLILDHRGEVAYYTVAARIGAGTARARFGRLGSLDLRFAPGRREGALGCAGGEGWQRGTFRGAIDFHGEHHYADVHADRIRGWFQTHPAAGCSGGRQQHAAAAATASRTREVAETGVNLEGFTSLGLPARYFYFFTESRPGGVRTSYNAFLDERREGMLIERGAQAYGGASGLDWNLGTGTARVEPPAPFSGRAFLRRGSDGRSSWTGSLSAPVLGGKPLRLTGSVFETHFGPAR